MKIRNFGTTLAVIFLVAVSGCYNHYSNTEPVIRMSDYPKLIERAKKDKRYLIMHSGVDDYTITSVEVEKSKKQFTVHLNKPDSLNLVKMNNPKSSGEKLLHMYMRDSTSYTLDEPHTIPLNKVARIELVN